jgi:glutamyl-tRNA(Gln) amidotransferase subunit E
LIDFKAIGFKCGVEVHQRVDSHKLFCECYCNPNKEGEKGQVFELKRRLAAVAGELGGLDPAAAFEAARGKEFTYFSDSKTSCLVECDEEPPHQINEEAVKVALQIALALGARPVDEVQVMRKTVVDGSAVSGFQRTALVALNGLLETSRGRVGIPTICVEEESAGIVEKSAGSAAYRLDRLGIPLIEIASDASIKDGVHAAEVAEKIGLLLRTTGRVQRGIGTIRQDLNVSVEGGARVEIKGAQELAAIPAIVENEARRQVELIKIKKKLAGKKKIAVQPAVRDVTHLLKEDGPSFVRKAISEGASAMAVKLEGFAGLLGRELMENHRLGTELSDYARASAGVKGIIHSDEDPAKYSLEESVFSAVARQLGCTASDAWVLCVEKELVAVKALDAAFHRARLAFDGVPSETRRVEGEKSVFMRPMPGADRMYPETDVAPLRLNAVFLAGVKPLEDFEARKKRFKAMGLNEELAEKILRGSEANSFEELVRDSGADALFVAVTLEDTLKALRRAGFSVDSLGIERLREVFSLYAKGRIVKAAVPELLKALCEWPAPAETVLREKKLEKFSSRRLAATVKALREEGVSEKQLFAEVMKRHRLNVDAGELQALLKKAF